MARTLVLGLLTLATAGNVVAHTVADFELFQPGMTIRLVHEDLPDDTGALDAQCADWVGQAGPGPGGSIVIDDADPGEHFIRQIRRDGVVATLVRFPTSVASGGVRYSVCDENDCVLSDPAAGVIWIQVSATDDPPQAGVFAGCQLWLVENVPGTMSVGGQCPPIPGDLAPGVEDARTAPPTWRPTGDGEVNIGDVVALLRAAVGLSVIECDP
jgi:hypothetical protein